MTVYIMSATVMTAAKAPVQETLIIALVNNGNGNASDFPWVICISSSFSKTWN